MTQEQQPERGVALPAEVAGQALGAKRAAAMALLGLAGMGVSAYLTYTHYRGGGYFCAGIGDCDYVNSSPYATLAGIPIAVLGFLVYAGIFGAALASLRGTGTLALSAAPLALFGLALGGVLFSAYLTYVELFILHAI